MLQSRWIYCLESLSSSMGGSGASDFMFPIAAFWSWVVPSANVASHEPPGGAHAWVVDGWGTNLGVGAVSDPRALQGSSNPPLAWRTTVGIDFGKRKILKSEANGTMSCVLSVKSLSKIKTMPKLFKNLLQKTCENLWKLVKTGENLLKTCSKKLVKTCENLWKLVKTC